MATRGLNKVQVIGNLGQEPETKFFPNGGQVTNISVATSEHWKDKQTGEPKEVTEWHRIVFSNKLAEIAAKYLKKGSKVYIEGKLHTRKWQNAQGVDQYTTEIRATEMQMLDARPQGADQGQPAAQQGGYQQPATQQQGGYQQKPAQQQGGYQQQAPKVNPQEPVMDFDDDIPFAPVGLAHNNMLMHCI